MKQIQDKIEDTRNITTVNLCILRLSYTDIPRKLHERVCTS